MNKDCHVYCTNCKCGKNLIDSITHNTKEPANCNNCNPYNPEDSTPYSERPEYVESI